MTQERTISSEKRSQILQRLQNNRGSRSKIDSPQQNQETANSLEDRRKLVVFLFEQQSQKDRIANRSGDLSARGDKNRRRTKVEQSQQPLEGSAALQRPQANQKKTLPGDLLADIAKWIGSEEIDLSTLSWEEIEERRKEAQYRHDWLQALLKEVQRELFILQAHMEKNVTASTSRQK